MSSIKAKQARNQFSELPQPPNTRISSRTNDAYFAGIENYIEGLSKHIQRIQEEEVEANSKLSEELNQLKDFSADKRAKNEEIARSRYLKSVNEIRERRKRFREMLYDAIQERKKLLDSAQVQKSEDEVIKRKLSALSEGQARKVSTSFGLKGTGLLTLLAIQIAFIVLFGIGTEFGDVSNTDPASLKGTPNRIDNLYSLYVHIALMVFVGFGFVVGYLRKAEFSSVGYSFLISAMAIQWSILVTGFFQTASNVRRTELDWSKLDLGIDSIIWGVYGATTVLVALGTTTGMLTPLAQVIFTFVLILAFGVNYFIGNDLLYAVDLGGSIFIYVFGSFFGLAFSHARFGNLLFPKRNQDAKFKNIEDNESSYESDMFALIGTIFLWVFWPSFNSAFAPDHTQYRSVINTVLSLCSSAIICFLFSRTFRGGKFRMCDIQRSTFAGGIAMASCTSFLVKPGGALVIGCAAGAISTLAQIHLQPALQKWSIHDTMSVSSSYGVTGLVGAISGIVTSAIAKDDKDGLVFGQDLNQLFPDRGDEQAGWNTLVLVITIGIAVGVGWLLGFFFRVFKFGEMENFYTDEDDWEVPSNFDLATRDTNQSKN